LFPTKQISLYHVLPFPYSEKKREYAFRIHGHRIAVQASRPTNRTKGKKLHYSYISKHYTERTWICSWERDHIWSMERVQPWQH